MSFILHIETATKVCSVALSSNGKLLGIKEIADDSFAHGEQLTVLIDLLLKECSLKISELNAVSVTSGPGSYTGLRIGVSTAKGICFTLGIPLIAVNALESLMQTGKEKHAGKTFIPMIDARRMEVYAAVYNCGGNILREIAADVLDESSYAEFDPFVYFGDGALKASELWENRNCTFDPEIRSGASGQVKPAFERFQSKQFEDVAYFEPFYLKEFHGTTPKDQTQ